MTIQVDDIAMIRIFWLDFAAKKKTVQPKAQCSIGMISNWAFVDFNKIFAAFFLFIGQCSAAL